MRLNLIVLLVTCLLGAGVTYLLDGNSHPDITDTNPASEKISGSQIPDFSFIDLQGKKHNITDFAGQTILLNFWATWCAPCVIEFPKLIQLAITHPDITLIALSSDTTDDAVSKFLKKNKKPIPKNMMIARDAKGHITADIFGTYKLPETLIISPSGKMVKKIVGDTDWTSKEINDFLTAVQSSEQE